MNGQQPVQPVVSLGGRVRIVFYWEVFRASRLVHDIDAPFGSPDGQCCAYMTCKHGGLLGGKSLTFDTNGRLRLTVGCPLDGRGRRFGLAKEHNRLAL